MWASGFINLVEENFQGWELTNLTHELAHQSVELSREPGSTQQWLPGSDRFNKVQLNKDLMIRKPD